MAFLGQYIFRILPDDLALSMQIWGRTWYDVGNNPVILQEGDLMPINDMIRNNVAIPAADASIRFETVFST